MLECVEPVGDETKPIATYPKRRGKRNFIQVERDNSAEADNKIEEQIKLCNKKKLMVVLEDINADKRLIVG